MEDLEANGHTIYKILIRFYLKLKKDKNITT